MNTLARWIGHRLARYLARPRLQHGTSAPADLQRLAECLRAGDVLLVEGHSKFSSAIKYLTQSTWSHAALYVGAALECGDVNGEPLCFIEADVIEGVRAVPLSAFAGLHARVCRPVSLRADELGALIGHARARIGQRYDLKNIVDLARYLLPTPPVPQHWRRHMLALGSGDPTRAICSTLIAQAFQSVRYPILPLIEQRSTGDPLCPACV